MTNVPTPPYPVSGLILAGGAGRRMGGADKGWLQWQGRALIEYAIDTLRPYAQELLISANRNLDRYGQCNARIVTDAVAGFAGPLRGLEAGLQHATADWMAFIPTDCPQLPVDLVPRLWSLRRGYPLVLASDSQGVIPVIGLIHCRLLTVVQHYLQSGQRGVGALWQQIPHAQLRLSDQESHNFNREEDFL